MSARPNLPRGSELTGSSSSTVRAVGEQLAVDPIAPCVFFQEGIDWRWVPWSRLAARLLETADRLGGFAALADVEVGSSSEPTLDALVLDLALLHLGAVPRPQRPATIEAWRGSGRPWVTSPSDPVLEGAANVGADPGLARRWAERRRVEAESLAAACPARRAPPVGAAAAWLRRPDRREVVVDVLELERPLCRAGVTWVLERGGALVLAHERSSLEATARWARPTRFWAETEGDRFAGLASAVLAGAGRRGRLVSALWSGAEAPEEAILEALRSRGVAVDEWAPVGDREPTSPRGRAEPAL